MQSTPDMSGVSKRPHYDSSAEDDDDRLDLGEILATLAEGKWLIVGTTLAVFALGALYILLATPIYNADGLIQVEEKKAGLSDLDISELFEGDTSVNAEIEILRSRLVLGRVVDNLNLAVRATPDYMPVIGAALARRGPEQNRPAIQIDTLQVPYTLIDKPLRLIAGAGDRFLLLDGSSELIAEGVVGTVARAEVNGEPLTLFVAKMQAKPGGRFNVEKLSRLRAIETLQRALNITEKGKASGILAINLEGVDPVKVSETVNEIANVYVRKNVERKSAEAEKTLEFLDEQLPVVKQHMEAAEVALNSYRLEKGSIDLPLETQVILETIVSVDQKINELRQERDKMTEGFTPEHPVVIALDKQIARLNGELEDLNREVRDLPNTQQEVLRLVREAEVNTALYTSLLNTAQELRVIKAGTVGNVRVVDYAVPPYKPVKPRKALVSLLALIVGVLAGIAAVVIRKTLRAGVDDPDLIEKNLGIPVYATIAHSKRQDRLVRELKAKKVRSAVLAVVSPDDTAIESLRNLRTALHFGMMDVKNNCIMIAGPSPEVGKSFVSVNLAAVLASNDKKVLLIDADMRRGRVHDYLGLEREPGLSHYISGDTAIGDLVQTTHVAGLSFIATGKIPPNPAELLLHERFAECLQSLSPKYDYVIVDSPPILAVTDATIIGQLVGATLMVLKAGVHPMREIEQSVKRLRQAQVNLRGLLFNDVDVYSQRYGAAKYSYQYQYNTKKV